MAESRHPNVECKSDAAKPYSASGPHEPIRQLSLLGNHTIVNFHHQQVCTKQVQPSQHQNS